MILRRSAEVPVRRALKTFRAVLIAGPRQAGKTTLARLVGEGRQFVNLDDLSILSAARTDPQGFVRNLRVPVTIDEIQRVPDLLLPIKQVVDEHPQAGSFLLTGSADPLSMRGVHETLAGRLAVITLRPLTWAERSHRPEWNPLTTLSRCSTAAAVVKAFPATDVPQARLEREVPLGGFPEPVLRFDERQRAQWHEQFARLYLERDVPLFVRPDDIAGFLRFVRLVASISGGILNLAHLARDAQMSHDTARRWLSVLQSTFLAQTLRPYWRNVRKRLTKAPKLHFADTGLAAHLLGLRDWRQAEHLNLAGALTESWVHHHLDVFRACAEVRMDLHYFHTAAGDECDFVVEADRLIPIEVKTTQTPSPKDSAGLRVFLDLLPRHAPFGVLLYPGTRVFPAADRVVAIPMSAFLCGTTS
ncbi:MAG: ATP-binding protein [Planctomycetes bacterium]|nr:ATP-binding protein [Planctomycetota bacterium]